MNWPCIWCHHRAEGLTMDVGVYAGSPSSAWRVPIATFPPARPFLEFINMMVYNTDPDCLVRIQNPCTGEDQWALFVPYSWFPPQTKIPSREIEVWNPVWLQVAQWSPWVLPDVRKMREAKVGENPLTHAMTRAFFDDKWTWATPEILLGNGYIPDAPFAFDERTHTDDMVSYIKLGGYLAGSYRYRSVVPPTTGWMPATGYVLEGMYPKDYTAAQIYDLRKNHFDAKAISFAASSFEAAARMVPFMSTTLAARDHGFESHQFWLALTGDAMMVVPAGEFRTLLATGTVGIAIHDVATSEENAEKIDALFNLAFAMWDIGEKIREIKPRRGFQPSLDPKARQAYLRMVGDPEKALKHFADEAGEELVIPTIADHVAILGRGLDGGATPLAAVFIQQPWDLLEEMITKPNPYVNDSLRDFILKHPDFQLIMQRKRQGTLMPIEWDHRMVGQNTGGMFDGKKITLNPALTNLPRNGHNIFSGLIHELGHALDNEDPLTKFFNCYGSYKYDEQLKDWRLVNDFQEWSKLNLDRVLRKEKRQHVRQALFTIEALEKHGATYVGSDYVLMKEIYDIVHDKSIKLPWQRDQKIMDLLRGSYEPIWTQRLNKTWKAMEQAAQARAASRNISLPDAWKTVFEDSDGCSHYEGVRLTKS